MIELNAYRQVLGALPAYMKSAEVEGEKNDILSVAILDGQPGGMSASDKTALFVKVTGERTGMTYTQNLEKDPMFYLEEAYANSQYVNASEPDQMLSAIGQALEGVEPIHYELETLQEAAQALSLDVYACSDDFSHVEVRITETIRTIGIVNSLGLDRTFSNRIVEASVEITTKGQESRSLYLETSVQHLEDLRGEYFISRIKRWLEYSRNPVALQKNDMEAVLDGTVLCNILLTAWQMFCAPQYLNHQTPLCGRQGEQIFSKEVTLVDDPFTPDSGYVRVFDCEGSICSKTEVVKEGRFLELLHNLTSAEDMGVFSTGNAGRDVNLIQDQTEVRIIPTNFQLKAGRNTQEELLHQLQDGIFIYESFDMFHSVNIASGDFAIPCKGLLYEEGKVKGHLDGLTISGNLLELLQSVKALGNDTATLSVVMSKSYQVMAPSIYVSALHVTGG